MARTNPATLQPYLLDFDSITLDPYTGVEIFRTKEPGGLRPVTRHNLIGVLVSLHYRLALPGSVGVWLFGIAALVWVFDCFVDFYLTLPEWTGARRIASGSSCWRTPRRAASPSTPESAASMALLHRFSFWRDRLLGASLMLFGLIDCPAPAGEAPRILLQDEFTASHIRTDLWRQDDRAFGFGILPPAVGDITPSVSGGKVVFAGTQSEGTWSGSSLVTAVSFTASLATTP